METQKIKFICNVVRWFDKQNGNTYHSVSVTRCEDGAIIKAPFQYGYGEQYRYTALNLILNKEWIKGYSSENIYFFERENNYPIHWNVTDATKKECINNGVV